MASMDLLWLTIAAPQWNGWRETVASRMAKALTETRVALPLATLRSRVLTLRDGHAHRQQYRMQRGGAPTRARVSCKHKRVVQQWHEECISLVATARELTG